VSAPDRSAEITGILETILYVADVDRAERFYADVLGLRRIGKEAGRHVFFRVGAGVLLLFRSAATQKRGALPAHGAEGQIHVCFTTTQADYGVWRERLQAHGIPIEQEIQWPRGRSFYFRDPDGNLLELANADIWPR
jgi:catechol 2,3-dioxygenase-like lactoylglutathione lyase family enzyme